ncbi:transposase [Nocardiopsis sp. Huas11]|uniref:transposase n=1 Tax=Nocardiopsis sp. Huas11 TaxID=2183912 RepID=UPI000EAE44D5
MGWRAKELLRDLLRLAFKHTRQPGPLRDLRGTPPLQLPHRRLLPSPRTPCSRRDINNWWDGVEAYVTTGSTNAASEGSNHLIKLEARNAFGFRNRANQPLRYDSAKPTEAAPPLNSKTHYVGGGVF